MPDSDLNQPQIRVDSKTDYLIPDVGTMATVSGVACNISGLTPSERAARDAV